MNIIEDIRATGFNAQAGVMFLMLGAVTVGPADSREKLLSRFWLIVSQSPFFWNKSEEECSAFFEIARTAWGRISINFDIAIVQAGQLLNMVLTPIQRQTAIVLALEVAFAPGGMNDLQLILIKSMKIKLELPQDVYDKLFLAAAIRVADKNGMLNLLK